MNNNKSKFTVTWMALVLCFCGIYGFSISGGIKKTESAFTCPTSAPNNVGSYCCPKNYNYVTEDGSLCYNDKYDVENGTCTDGGTTCTKTAVKGTFKATIKLNANGGKMSVSSGYKSEALYVCNGKTTSCSFTCTSNDASEDFCRDLKYYHVKAELSGYHFNYWGTSEDCISGISYGDKLYEDTELYACFIRFYYISYHPNGGLIVDTRKEDNICAGSTYCTHANYCLASVASEGCSASVDLSAEKSGASFRGWSLTTDCEEILSNSLYITDDTVVYACWSS